MKIRETIKMKTILFLSLFILLDSVICNEYVTTSLKRSSFPADFVFGTASSAYQYEGAANEGGRGPSIWDTFARENPDRIRDNSSGVLAVDSYHRYKEDVQIMRDIGFDAYRFSISWSRLLPGRNLSAGVNPEGLKYYNHLIKELLSKGLKPFVTLFHWDLPQALEDEYGGFLNPQIVKDFQDYAELCFKEFGDRVKYWITLNEPLTFTSTGYASGEFAPGRCSKWVSSACHGGDSGTEPYIVAHHLILAHGAAVKVYRDKYQMSQKGQIGISLNSPWIEPLNNNSMADRKAASQALDFLYGWFMEPLNSGSYPISMVIHVGERLPKFSEEQSSTLKGSFDFIGLNYYSATYATSTACETKKLSYLTDSCVRLSQERDGNLIGPRAASTWLCVYPEGIQDLLLYTKDNNPVVYITENGVDEYNDGTLSLNDTMRIEYYTSHLSYLQRAIMNGVNLKGFFAWSLMDNFEWIDGYTVRFGIIFVDYGDGLKRYPKYSASWFKGFLQGENQIRPKQ